MRIGVGVAATAVDEEGGKGGGGPVGDVGIAGVCREFEATSPLLGRWGTAGTDPIGGWWK